MNQAYQNMRSFWLDATNFQTRKGLLEIGANRIVAAGIEMVIPDGTLLKHVWVATNSLGDSSLSFENNSKSGLGGMIGGHDNEPLQQAAARMLAYAGKLSNQMRELPSSAAMPSPTRSGQIGIWAISKEKYFYTEFAEEELRNPQHPFYPLFAYSQQMIGLFKTQPNSQNPPARA